MSYRYETDKTAAETNWSHGREGHKITGITIHHWGASRHLDFDGIVDFLCEPRPDNPTSAAYVAQGVDQQARKDRRVACIVDPDDTAYHAGNWDANLDTVGIECRPHPHPEDYDVVGELVAELRGTYGDVPLYPHRHWTATACPGSWDLDRIDRYAAKHARSGQHDRRPEPGPQAKPQTKPRRRPKLRRGSRGKAVRSLQRGLLRIFPAYAGPIRRTGGADSVFGPGTEAVVKEFQRRSGLLDDGIVGPITWRELGKYGIRP